MNQETTAASIAAESQDGNIIGRRPTKSVLPEYIEDLVGDGADNVNRKGILISLAVILTICGFVVLSVFLLTPEQEYPVVPKVSANDIVDEKWKLPDYTWRNSILIFTDTDGNVAEMTTPDKKLKILIEKEIIKQNGIVDYKISESGDFALLIFNKIPIYSFSYNASYYVYDVKRKTKEMLIHQDSVSIFQFADFGRGNSIIYSFDGDLYLKEGGNVTRLTTGGIFGIYQNGIADWIYEEEILKSSAAFWFSPSGKYLAYASFDDTKVEDSYVTMYNDYNLDDILPYKKIVKYKYPKAGRRIPTVNIHAIDLKTMDMVTFIKPVSNGQRLDTFHSLTWVADDELLITWSNRTMTSSVMQQCFPTIATCMDDVIKQSITEGSPKTNSKAGWLTNLGQQPLLTGDSDMFFYILPSDHGGMGEFNHLVMVNKTKKPSSMRFMTDGNWEVTKILHYDAIEQKVYYISNEFLPGSRHVYSVDQNLQRECITCSLQVENAIENNKKQKLSLECGKERTCRYYDASFGSDSDCFLLKCLGACLPHTGVLEIKTNKFQVIRDPILSLGDVMPLTTYDTIHKNGYSIRIKMLLPDRIHVGKRPVVFFKEDLGSQTTGYRFRVDLASYIVTSIGATGVFVDGRGSGSSGNKVLQSVTGRPGVLEIEDMKTVIEYLKDKESIDVSSVGVVGSSGYGGYVATLALTHSEFTCGVAQSPVTNWKLYSSFGSERILGSPEENPLLYSRNNLVHQINEVSESQLRIFHGLQDRKVNMQHSVILQEAAFLSNQPLEAVSVKYHPSVTYNSRNLKKIQSNVYQSISSFLMNCLLGNSEVGIRKLDLLKSNYGIPT